MGKTYRRRSEEDHNLKRVKGKKKHPKKGRDYYDNDSSNEGNADYLEWQEKLDRQERG